MKRNPEGHIGCSWKLGSVMSSETHHSVYPPYHELWFKFTSRNNMFFWRE